MASVSNAVQNKAYWSVTISSFSAIQLFWCRWFTSLRNFNINLRVMLSLSAMLVVSVVFFSNSFQKKKKLLWNVCTTSVQGAFRASCILHVFFSSVISSKTNFIAILITLSQFLLGFSCFSSVTVCKINEDIRQYLFCIHSYQSSYFTSFLK
jgi:hypothetical protein